MKFTAPVIFLILTNICCKQKYEVFLAPTQTSFLVVEGDIITNGVTTINLSRTTPLDKRMVLFEKDAEVVIESGDNKFYPLVDKDSGRYELPFSNLDENTKYRLNIKTHDNREYVSSYVQVIKTPVIDTITWTRYNDGIEIYVNTDDPENNTQYYRFAYEETWEYKSPYKQRMIAKYVATPRPGVVVTWYDPIRKAARDSITDCWRFKNSSRILVGTIGRLTENKVYMPLVSYPKGAGEFAHFYSIKVKQYGITKDEYDFFQKMKKNTESLGTIFDVQPSELSGNVRCLTDTSEMIIGFVGATRYREKRTFIDNKDLIDWNYKDSCMVIPVEPDFLPIYFPEGGTSYLPIEPGVVDKKYVINVSESECIDCTLTGTNQKPSYWP